MWDMKEWNWEEKFGEDGGVGTSIGCGVLRGKNVHKNDVKTSEIAGLQCLDGEHCMIDGAQAIGRNKDNLDAGYWMLEAGCGENQVE